MVFLHSHQSKEPVGSHTYSIQQHHCRRIFNLLKQEKENNEKLNQEIWSLISENNSIKFENLTLKAKVNELRNTIDAYSDQIDNEWERPKNLLPQKPGTPYMG